MCWNSTVSISAQCIQQLHKLQQERAHTDTLCSKTELVISPNPVTPILISVKHEVPQLLHLVWKTKLRRTEGLIVFPTKNYALMSSPRFLEQLEIQRRK